MLLKAEPILMTNSKEACDNHSTVVFEDDIRKVRDKRFSLEPETFPDKFYSKISLVYVLSGRGSALGEPIDNPNVADPGDDRERMKLGVRVANQIFRVTGTYVPIYYNGRKPHNEHLARALEIPKQKGGFDYPKEHFIIQNNPTENTVQQAQGFKKFLEKTRHVTIALISSAYHLPRVARTFGKDSPSIKEEIGGDAMEKVSFILFGIDRDFQRKGAEEDAAKEVNAMMNYSSGIGKKPSVSRYQPNNTYLNFADVMIGWSFTQHIYSTYPFFPELISVKVNNHSLILFSTAHHIKTKTKMLHETKRKAEKKELVVKKMASVMDDFEKVSAKQQLTYHQEANGLNWLPVFSKCLLTKMSTPSNDLRPKNVCS